MDANQENVSRRIREEMGARTEAYIAGLRTGEETAKIDRQFTRILLFGAGFALGMVLGYLDGVVA